MSDAGRRWLEATLARLGSAGSSLEPGASDVAKRRRPKAPAMPGLAARRPEEPTSGSLVALRWPEADPLSGYCGVADGTQVLARLGDALLACLLTSEREGPRAT